LKMQIYRSSQVKKLVVKIGFGICDARH